MRSWLGVVVKTNYQRTQRAGSLSGGVRCWPSLGPLGQPGLLLLNEPSPSLTPESVGGIFEYIVAVSGVRMTILPGEQDANRTLTIVNWAYVLDLGTVFLEGSGDSLMNYEQVRMAYSGGWRHITQGGLR